MKHRRFRSALVVLLPGAALCLLPGCIVQDHGSAPPPADTRIEFGEVTNFGYTCGGPLTSWTVTNRETSDQGTAGCEQPVLFVGLAPNATYTFDVVGYSGSRLCWQGSCSVEALGYTTSFADCSSQIQHLCGM